LGELLCFPMSCCRCCLSGTCCTLQLNTLQLLMSYCALQAVNKFGELLAKVPLCRAFTDHTCMQHSNCVRTANTSKYHIAPHDAVLGEAAQ
jgi:hypothetical protein